MPKPKPNYNWTGKGAKEPPPAPFNAIFIANSKFYAEMMMEKLNYAKDECLFVEIQPVMIRNFYALIPDAEGDPTVYVCASPYKLLQSNQRKLYRSLMDTLSYLKHKNFTIIYTEGTKADG